MTPVPDGYPRIRMVHSFEELVRAPWADGVNALCWPRTLPDGCAALLDAVPSDGDLTPLDDATLERLGGAPGLRAAVRFIQEDLRLLRHAGHAPVLERVDRYARDDADAVVATDVYSFHADRAPVPTDTFLCTYAGPPSEGLRNDEAQRRVDLPETRAALMRLSGGTEGAAFDAFLMEHSFDLHYAPMPHARPFPFGVGHLWRLAVAYPGCPVPPCIHRAPGPAHAPRLLLIS